MPYTTEQLQSVSTLFTSERIGVADAVSMLREMERQSVVHLCEYSGEIIEGEPFVVETRRSRPVPSGRHATWSFRWLRQYWVERHYFADEDNAAAFGCRQCDCCGEWVMPDEAEADGVQVYDNWFCSYDCAHDNGWEECENCGSWVHEDDMVYIEDGHCFCDRYCAERAGWRECERCEEWVHEDDAFTVMCRGEEQLWCESCYDYSSSYCEECGEHVHEDEVSYDEELGEYVCDSCREGMPEPQIGRWNYTPSVITLFGGTPGDAPFMGVELETDGGHSRNEYAATLEAIERFREHWWMTDDGSLDSSGIELTSHPMTLAYHESIRWMYDDIKAAASKFDYKSHDTGRCGLHVSIDKTWFGKTGVVQDANIYKLMRLTQRFERQLTTFSRRTDNHWCRYNTSLDYSPSKVPFKVNLRNGLGIGEKNVFAKSNEFMMNEREKYRAVNICHRDHVEIRIFRGTLKWSTYFASLALVDGLARVVKQHGSIWVESVNWYDLVDEIVAAVRKGGNEFSAECLENYLDEKGLRR